VVALGLLPKPFVIIARLQTQRIWAKEDAEEAVRTGYNETRCWRCSAEDHPLIRCRNQKAQGGFLWRALGLMKKTWAFKELQKLREERKQQVDKEAA
jgi:hypothetical protein